MVPKSTSFFLSGLNFCFIIDIQHFRKYSFILQNSTFEGKSAETRLLGEKSKLAGLKTGKPKDLWKALKSKIPRVA